MIHEPWWFWLSMGFSGGVLFCMSVNKYWEVSRRIAEWRHRAEWFDEDQRKKANVSPSDLG